MDRAWTKARLAVVDYRSPMPDARPDGIREDRRDAIRVGVIGAMHPAEINPLMATLGPRMRLSCVHEPVALMAARVSEEAGVPAVGSLTKLATRRGMQAAIVHQTGGPLSVGLHACRPLLKADLPTLWLPDAFDAGAIVPGLSSGGLRRNDSGDTPRMDPAVAEVWRDVARLDDANLLCPALTHRFDGATLRLRELVAGSLGPVLAVEAAIHDLGDREVRQEHAMVARALDWARWIGYPRLERINDETAGKTWRMSSAAGPAATVTVVAAPKDARDEIEYDASHQIRRHINCERGEAIVDGGGLRWRPADGDAWTEVDLSEERPALAVIADLFARRVIGGLVPTPSVDDVLAVEAVL